MLSFLTLLSALFGCEKTTPNIPIVIVAGQSNAVGFGQHTPSPANPKIIWRGLDFPRGIGVSFAEAYLQRTLQSKIIVVQCAVGGTSIEQWQPGSVLYEQCLQIVGQVKKEYPTSYIATILFWQGEADTQFLNIPWADKFTNVVRAFRYDLQIKNLPVVFCQIHNHAEESTYPSWAEIQKEQASVSLPFVTMVGTSDTQMADSLHVGPQGLVVVGRRMAAAYFRLFTNLCGC